MPSYRVQCATYNGHLGVGSSTEQPDITSWLVPTLSEGSEKYASQEPPDVYAIGFQEVLPLHLALLGMTKTVLNNHSSALQAAIEKHAQTTSATSTPSAYTLVAKKVIGGIALLVYTRNATVTPKVRDVKVATSSCGIGGLMGNKGAVGVRLVLDDEEEDSDSDGGDSDVTTRSRKSARREKRAARRKERGEKAGTAVMTFVTAHLAAHDSGLERRNQDFKSIVERLVFARGEEEEAVVFPARSSLKNLQGADDSFSQIYDTSYLFFFGDLNYRISPKTPKPLPLHVMSHKIVNKDWDFLLKHDQLKQEQSKGATLTGLWEGAIEFAPTYKYIVGSVDKYKAFTKRVPGWCDRILVATWADGPDGAGTVLVKSKRAAAEGASAPKKERRRKGPKVELYRALREFTMSDHKPVTAIFSLPRHPKRTAHPAYGPEGLRLPFKAPFAIDPSWRRKKLIGKLMDQVVGAVWCFIVLLGAGKSTKIGIANLIGLSVVWYYRGLLGFVKV